MEFVFPDDRIGLRPSKEDYPLFRAAVHKRILKAMSGGIPIEHNDAWVLVWYLDRSLPEEPFPVNLLPSHIPAFIDAVAEAKPDLQAEELPLAEAILSGLATALVGYELLQAASTIPEYLPESFQ